MDALTESSRTACNARPKLEFFKYTTAPSVSASSFPITIGGIAPLAEVATGFQFWPPESPELLHAISRASTLYADKRAWVAMQRRAMKADFSWDRSATLYARLFAELVGATPAARVLLA